ncbi:MAG: sigma-70 family RNA polymerase sigma factor [Candidatus Zixiibacteriota bacterium]|nr:MAG: sigma-70 family RNA polymerase sigma factor [candidate division Zixibacteria bacterium]
MSGPRLVYQNWIVEIGINPAEGGSRWPAVESVPVNERVVETVRKALSRLSPTEQEFVRRYYFQGESYAAIAGAMRKRVSGIDGFHRRILARLRKYLAPFVAEEFGLEVTIGGDCPLCNSPFVDKINQLIATRQMDSTWRPIIRKLKKEFGIAVKTPQVLIGHQKYHMTDEVKDEG